MTEMTVNVQMLSELSNLVTQETTGDTVSAQFCLLPNCEMQGDELPLQLFAQALSPQARKLEPAISQHRHSDFDSQQSIAECT